MTLTPHMPDGQPAPAVMTPEDAATFLRLKASDVRSALRTLRGKGLRTVMFGGEIRYSLDEVLRFIDSQIKDEPR